MSAQQDAELSPGIFPSALRGDEVISALHLRCWKTGTPHRGGREAPRSPGVLGQAKKRRMSSIRAAVLRPSVTPKDGPMEGEGGLRV